jgi:orotate phosphoribosyltransferase
VQSGSVECWAGKSARPFLLSQTGATIRKTVCAIDRQEGARENMEQAGYAFEALLTRQDLGI